MNQSDCELLWVVSAPRQMMALPQVIPGILCPLCRLSRVVDGADKIAVMQARDQNSLLSVLVEV